MRRPLCLLVALSSPLAAGCGSSSHDPAVEAGVHGGGSDAALDASASLCQVTGPTNATGGLLVRGTLLLPSGPSKGELLVSTAGLIACAAASCAASAGYASATVIDCPNGVVSPALLNPHDHTEYATVSPEDHGTIRYEHRSDWRVGAEGATPLPSVPSTTDAPTIAAQELRILLGGATAVVGTGAVPGLVRNLAVYNAQHDETEGLTEPTIYFDTFPLDDTAGRLLTSGCAYPSIESAKDAFATGRYEPHIAEGINLAAENELTCTSLSSNDLVTSKTSIVHGVGTNASDVSKIAAAGAIVIWSPRSNISLYGDTTPVTELKYAGVTVALGTDWLATGSMNSLRELACADALNQRYFAGAFSDADLFDMVTINAAKAAGFDGELGSLDVGKVADLTVFDGTTNPGYRGVIDASTEDVHLVLRGGKPLYGDAALVSGLAPSCTPWTVCGEARAVCIDTPGLTLAQVESVASSVYAIASCRGATPPGEPTCVPYRDSYPDGTSSTDRDGDGVPDATDDCPDIFNPVRPMDGSTQADADGDGFGDACDAAPLDRTKH